MYRFSLIKSRASPQFAFEVGAEMSEILVSRLIKGEGSVCALDEKALKINTPKIKIQKIFRMILLLLLWMDCSYRISFRFLYWSWADNITSFFMWRKISRIMGES